MFTVTLVSCGPKTKTKYVENPFDPSGLNTRIDVLEARVAALESGFTDLTISAAALSAQATLQEAQIGALQAQLANDEVQGTDAYNALLAQITALQGQQAQTLDTIASIQNAANETQAELTDLVEGLDGETRVTKLIDPCGDAPNIYDEVMMVMNNGKVVAYFEDGSDRHLSVLVPDAAYETTDGSHCRFSVNAMGQLN